MKRLIPMVLSGFMALASPAGAHDFYPQDCCSGQDCAPVDKTDFIPPHAQANMYGIPTTGLMVMEVTTRNGTARVVDGITKRYESPDHRLHACIRCAGYGGQGGCYVRCIFLPPSL